MGGISRILDAARSDSAPDTVQTESAPESIPDTDLNEAPVDIWEDDTESADAEGSGFRDLDGNWIELSDFIGEIVVLNFWASWCPPCKAEMPDLNELDQELKASGDTVLFTVNMTDGQRETEATAREFIEETGYGFTVLLDEQGILAYRYNINAIPQTFILDRDGYVSASIIGATSKEIILDKINAVE